MAGVGERKESQRLRTVAEGAAGHGERYRMSSPRIRFGEVARGPAGPYWLLAQKYGPGLGGGGGGCVVPLQL